MSREAAFIAALRRIATHPAARGLEDDAAVLVPPAGEAIILTHDMMVEGVHFLPGDPPADVAWKLLAVNLSDLAAKGARPIGVLLGYPLAPQPAWDEAFLEGLAGACERLGAPLLGGDTVAGPAEAPRMLGLTAIGSAAAEHVPARSGAKAGDQLWVSGRIGAAGIGLRMARGELPAEPTMLDAYRRPMPRLALGQAVAPHASAMMDLSDGLLLDARRMAEASGLAATIALDALPLAKGADALEAATAGDDYELLIAAPPSAEAALFAAARAGGDVPLTRIGAFRQGAGLSLIRDGAPVALPRRLGYEHD